MTWKLKKHDLLGLLPEALVLTRTRDQDLRYLSFDDGPDPEHTPKLLDTLARHGVKASFFLVGEKIEQYPEIVQRIVADGHMIGNHSYSHWSFRNMDLRKQLDEVYKTDALLRLFDNRPYHRMRPPHGYVGAKLLLHFARRKRSFIYWSYDSLDYQDRPIEALISVAPYPRQDLTTLTPEYKAIIDLCRNWRSVAEVSALLRLPLGVTRVLIADMAHEGLLRLHQSPFTEGQPDLQLLERVLSGLRKL